MRIVYPITPPLFHPVALTPGGTSPLVRSRVNNHTPHTCIMRIVYPTTHPLLHPVAFTLDCTFLLVQSSVNKHTPHPRLQPQAFHGEKKNKTTVLKLPPTPQWLTHHWSGLINGLPYLLLLYLTMNTIHRSPRNCCMGTSVLIALLLPTLVDAGRGQKRPRPIDMTEHTAALIITNFMYRVLSRCLRKNSSTNEDPTSQPILLAPPHLKPRPRNCLRVTTTNIQRGLQQHHKYISIVEHTRRLQPTIHVVTETGPIDPTRLRHYTTFINEDDLESPAKRQRMARDHLSHFPYHISASPPSATDAASGVAIFVHKDWVVRKMKNTFSHPSGRWLRQSYRGPISIITIYGAYLRVNPTPSNEGGHEWLELLHDIAAHHAKGHAIILAGDINMSFNSTLYRSSTDKTSHLHQHTLLETALTRYNLVDSFTYLYPTAVYRTWENTTGDWSSPDHILVSSQLANRLKYAAVTGPFSDHYSLSIDIDLLTTITIQKPNRPRMVRDKEESQEYADKVADILSKTPPPTSMDDRIINLMQAMTTVEHQMWLKKGHVHRSKSKGETTLIRLLRRAKKWKRSPVTNRRPTVISRHTLSLNNIDSVIRELQKDINKLAKARMYARNSVYRQIRSRHFRERRLGKFLTSTLNRYSTYTGIIGCITPNGALITQPPLVKQMATDRIATEFFRLRVPPPPFLTDLTSPIPEWWSQVFPHTLNPEPSDPLYDSILDPISLSFLNKILTRMHSNKSGGPSGLVVESFRWLNDATKTEWLLPWVNHCLETGTSPLSIKKFQVWATEKSPGEGSMLSHSGKVNVRPIALFETAYKVIENVIQKRLQTRMFKHHKLHNSQYGFTPGKGVDDLLIIYRLLIEDAHHRGKELHLSSNDCSQAYDSIATWTMQEIYKFHRFPPRLIKLLLDLDSNQTGHIITAYGIGPAFQKRGGLGQGSVLAPLKWNLFLDPMLKHLTTIGDPYVILDPTPGSTPATPINIYSASFADDVSGIAPNHRSYLLRMDFTNTYLVFFGVHLNNIKTKYSYIRAPSVNQEPVKLTNSNNIKSPSAVISPHTPTRLLGGLMSLSLNWEVARKSLLDDVHSILNILTHKRLSMNEFIYVIQTVLMAKLRYYTNVVPLTQEEISELDTRIRSMFRRKFRIPKSLPNPVLHLPYEMRGFNLPSVAHHIDCNLILQGHRLLNDKTLLGTLTRGNLCLLQTHAGLTTNPLQHPALSKSWPSKFWTSGLAGALNRQTAQMPLLHPDHQLHLPRVLRFTMNIPGPRTQDTPLHTALGDNFTSILPLIRNRPERHVGDFASKCGRRFFHPEEQTNKGIRQIRTLLTAPNTNILKTMTSPSTTRIVFPQIRHPPNSIVGLPLEIVSSPNEYRSDKLKYFQVICSYIKDTTPMVDVHPLRSITRLHHLMSEAFNKITNISLKPQKKWRAVTSITGSLRVPHYKIFTYNAKNLYQISGYTSIPLRIHRTTCPSFLITQEDSVTVAKTSAPISGRTSPAVILDIVNKQRQSCYIDDSNLVRDVTVDEEKCTICNLRGSMIICEAQINCTGVYHPQCLPDRSHELTDHWICPRCSALPTDPPPWLEPLTTAELQQLRSAKIIYSAGDGSVSSTVPKQATFGIVFMDETGRVIARRSKRFIIREDDISSFRSELEALIGVYLLLPSDLSSDHTIDNESAQKIHDIMALLQDPPLDRRWIQKPHFSAIWRLHQAIFNHDTPLILTHTLSHLENEHTEDLLLRLRRLILKMADELASEAHLKEGSTPPMSGDLLFSLFLDNKKVECCSLKTLHSSYHSSLLNQLQALPMTGQIYSETAHVNISSWPQHLRTFLIKIMTDRLPVRSVRHKRQDKHANGSRVLPTCTACRTIPPPLETRDHFLQHCQVTKKRKWQHLQKIATFFRQFIQPYYYHNSQSIIHLKSTHNLLMTPGWSRRWLDKHKRVIDTIHGQDTILLNDELDSIRPDMFRTLESLHWSTSDMPTSFSSCLDPIIISSIASRIHHSITSSPLPAIPGNLRPHIPINHLTHFLEVDESETLTLIMDLTQESDPNIRKTLCLLNEYHRTAPDITGIAITASTQSHPQWLTLASIPPKHLGVLSRSFWTGRYPWNPTHTNQSPITVLTHKSLPPHIHDWILEILDARSLLPTSRLWTHNQINIDPLLYPEIPPFFLCSSQLRHSLGFLSPEEWRHIPGLYTKQIQTKARKLARLNAELLHSQWLSRNALITDKDVIIQDALQRQTRDSPPVRSLTKLSISIQKLKRKERQWVEARDAQTQLTIQDPLQQTHIHSTLSTTPRPSGSPGSPSPQPTDSNYKSPPSIQSTTDSILISPPPKRRLTTSSLSLQNSSLILASPPSHEEIPPSIGRHSIPFQETSSDSILTTSPPDRTVRQLITDPITEFSGLPSTPLGSIPQTDSHLSHRNPLCRSFFKTLLDDDWSLIHTLTSRPTDHTTITTVNKTDIRYSSLHCLRQRISFHDPSFYVNDAIIAAALHIISVQLSTPTLAICPFHTGFYTLIHQATPSSRRKEMSKAARQLAGTRGPHKGSSIFNKNWILFPQHIRTNHWALLAINIPNRCIHWIDSMMVDDPDDTEFLERSSTFESLLNEAWVLTSGSQPPAWQKLCHREASQQPNTVDCAIYMLAYSILLCTNSPLTFSTWEATNWRSGIALLLHNHIPANHTLAQTAVTSCSSSAGERGGGGGGGVGEREAAGTSNGTTRRRKGSIRVQTGQVKAIRKKQKTGRISVKGGTNRRAKRKREALLQDEFAFSTPIHRKHKRAKHQITTVAPSLDVDSPPLEAPNFVPDS